MVLNFQKKNRPLYYQKTLATYFFLWKKRRYSWSSKWRHGLRHFLANRDVTSPDSRTLGFCCFVAYCLIHKWKKCVSNVFFFPSELPYYIMYSSTVKEHTARAVSRGINITHPSNNFKDTFEEFLRHQKKITYSIINR